MSEIRDLHIHLHSTSLIKRIVRMEIISAYQSCFATCYKENYFFFIFEKKKVAFVELERSSWRRVNIQRISLTEKLVVAIRAV